MEKIFDGTKEDPIQFQDFINRLLEKWHIISITLAVFLLAAFAYNKLSTPIYRATTSILIKESRPNSSIPANDLFPDFNLFNIDRSFNNEILVIKSKPLLASSLKEVDLNFTYYVKDGFVYKEAYKTSPYIVVIDKNNPQLLGLDYYVQIIDNKSFRLKVKGRDGRLHSFVSDNIIGRNKKINFKGTFIFGEMIVNELFSFKLILNENFSSNNDLRLKTYFRINSITDLVNYYYSKIDVETASENVTIARITIESEVVNKGIDILTSLNQEYLRRNFDQKNYIASNTIQFIDSQLDEIADSLALNERRLQNYRTSNEILNIGLKTGNLSEQLQLIENERARLTISSKYYGNLKEYFEQDNELSVITAPSSMGIDEPQLNNLIFELTALNSEKNSLIQNNQQKSPYLQQILIKIENLKNTITENITSSLAASEIALKDIEERYRRLKSEVDKLPRTERELLGIERKYNVNDAIYTFLLQRRAEAQISEASNLPDMEIIEPPVLERNAPIKPSKIMNYLVAFILGIILPAGFIQVSSIVKDEINTREELAKFTKIPILGEILHNNNSSDSVIVDFPKSAIAESFRAIRTDFNFFSKGKKNAVVLVTSSFGSEGKSFCSLNIATSFAQLGKKTILIGFDLRKPYIYKKLNSKTDHGVSSFLSNQAQLQDLIQKTNIENFHYLPAGAIPPNPVELIDSEKTLELLDQVKTIYDFIIIDSAPIRLVTDSYLLMQHADINILLIRSNFSSRKEVATTLQEMSHKKIKNICLVLNDTRGKRGKYGYGYYEKKK